MIIEIRAGSESDRAALLDFAARTAGTEQARVRARRWHWQWHDDPRLQTEGYRGVVAVWGRSIIANGACLPAGLYMNGVPVAAIWWADMRIDWGLTRQALKAMRRAGLAKQQRFPRGLAAALFEHPAAGAIQLGKHIEEGMMSIGERVGFTDVPAVGNRQRRISLRRPLAQRLGRVPGHLLAMVADLAVPLPRRSLPIRVLDGDFDARFDQLWLKACRAYPAITRRDAPVLNWHYRRHPDTRYRVLTLDQGTQGTELRGYLVYKVWWRRGRRIARIVDLLTAPADAEAIRALVAHALKEMRHAGTERADWFVAGADLAAVAAGLGFRARLTKTGRPQPLMARGLAARSIYVTAGDGDGG